MKKYFALLALLALVTIAACGCGKPKTNVGAARSEMTVTCFDVGKGDCLLIEKDGTTVLIDTGYAANSDQIIEALEEKQITALDYMIITHYDKDHAGSAPYLLEQFPVGTLYLPAYEGNNKCYRLLLATCDSLQITPQLVNETVSFTLADVSWQIFPSDIVYDAASGEEANDNDLSLVIGARYEKDSYLFAGDMEKAEIKSYLAAGHASYDVFKVPHHGNKAGNSDELIENVSPKIALITDSAEEPAESKLLALLEKASVTVYRTSLSGTITVTGNGTGNYRCNTSAD